MSLLTLSWAFQRLSIPASWALLALATAATAAEDARHADPSEAVAEDLVEEQRSAVRQAEAAQTRLALLAEISQFLLASLDHQAAIAGLARLVLPALGDGCFVDIEDSDGARRVAIAHVSPYKAGLLQKLDEADGLTALVGGALKTALRTGKAERGDVVDIAEPPAAGDEERRALVKAIDPRAYMAIPLVTRGRVLGAVVFLVTDSDRKYSADDLDFAQHVARRAATAVDNLRLYGEAQQARVAAEDANRLKDEFLATLSHELRTPLNAILGWARMMRSGSLDQATHDKALVTIERNALAQARIVEDLLDVSRVITGSMRLDLQQLDFGNLIDAAMATVRPAAEAKGIRVESHVERFEPMIGDPGRLQQVIWNLVSNATKFTPPDGRIKVRAERDGAEVVLRVGDTGAGISPQFLPHVFERFRQADSTTTRVHGGLGLGLAIVRHVVELHGGTVEADSPGIGQGATFTVRLPVRAAARRAEDRQASGRHREPRLQIEPHYELAGVTILVVDDESDARDLFASILRQRGAAVRAATSTREALEVLAEFAPHLVIADIGMPGEDGYALLRQMRKQHPNIPAVALTAYARPDDRRRALDAGFDMHLPKPIDPDELVNAVLDLSARPRIPSPSR